MNTRGWLSEKAIILNSGRIFALAGNYYSILEKGLNDQIRSAEPSPIRPALHRSGFEPPSIA